MVLSCKIMLRSLVGAVLLLFTTPSNVDSVPVSPTTTATLCPRESIPTNEVQPWPDNIISFSLSDNLTTDARREILRVMGVSEKRMCDRIVFVPRQLMQDAETGHFVSFVPGERCCSNKGKTGLQRQYVYINESCIMDRTLKNIIGTLIGDTQPTSTMFGDSHGPQNTTNDEIDRSQNITECQNPNVKRITGRVNGRDKQGHLLSPNYPMTYDSNTEFVWKITIPENAVLGLTFIDFITETKHDYLEVHFLNTTTGSIQSLDRISGNVSPEPISSHLSIDTVILRFHSDITYNLRGFNISYEFIENRHECDVDNGGCSYRCETDRSGIGNCICQTGYKANKSGDCKDINECRIASHGCAHNCRNTPGSYKCDCNEGYALHINKKHCESCREVYNRTRETIYSEGHPGRYLDYQNCLYTILVHPDHVLKLTISVVDITNTTDCKKEFLKMEHGYFKFNRRLCGYLTNISYYIKDENVTSTTLRFRTRNLNGDNNYSGFSVRYEQFLRSSVSDSELDTVHVGGSTRSYSDRPWLDL